MKNKILSLIACSLMILSSTTAYAQELPENTYEESAVEEVTNQQEQSTTEPVLAEETDAVAEEQTEDISVSENEEVSEDTDEALEEESLTEDEITEEETEEDLLLEEELLEEEEDDEDETYVVSFYDPISEDVFYSVEVKEGESVEELPEAPTHFNGKFYGYKGEYTDVEKDTTIVALYTPYYSVYELKSGKGTISGRTYDSEGLYLPNAKVVLNINGQITETVSSESAYYDLDIDMTDSFTGTIEFYDENGNYLYKSYICFGEEVSYDTSLIGEDLVFDDEEEDEEELEEELLTEETKEDELIEEDTAGEELLIDELEEAESTEDSSESIEEQTDDYIEPEQTQIEDETESNSSDGQSNTLDDNKATSDAMTESLDDMDIPESVVIDE